MREREREADIRFLKNSEWAIKKKKRNLNSAEHTREREREREREKEKKTNSFKKNSA